MANLIDYKILICGDRHYANYDAIYYLLKMLANSDRKDKSDYLPTLVPDRTLIIEARAHGVESLAKMAANTLGSNLKEY